MNKQQKIERIQELIEKEEFIPINKELDWYAEENLDQLLKYLEKYQSSLKSNEDYYDLINQISLWQEKYSYY